MTELLAAAKMALERLEKYTDGMAVIPGPNRRETSGDHTWSVFESLDWPCEVEFADLRRSN